MLPTIPRKVFDDAAMRPLLDLLYDTLLTPKVVGERWQYKCSHLSNLRRAGKGPSWITLPTGGVRYRASEIVGSELAGMCGALNLDHVLLAVSALKSIDGDAKNAVIIELREKFS